MHPLQKVQAEIAAMALQKIFPATKNTPTQRILSLSQKDQKMLSTTVPRKFNSG